MTRERVEQAIEVLRRVLPPADCTINHFHMGCVSGDAVAGHEALTTLSNALAESEKERDEERAAGRQANENSINLLEANQQLLRQLRESEKERERLRDTIEKALYEVRHVIDYDYATHYRVLDHLFSQALSPDSQEKRDAAN